MSLLGDYDQRGTQITIGVIASTSVGYAIIYQITPQSHRLEHPDAHRDYHYGIENGPDTSSHWDVGIDEPHRHAHYDQRENYVNQRHIFSSCCSFRPWSAAFILRRARSVHLLRSTRATCAPAGVFEHVRDLMFQLLLILFGIAGKRFSAGRAPHQMLGLPIESIHDQPRGCDLR